MTDDGSSQDVPGSTQSEDRPADKSFNRLDKDTRAKNLEATRRRFLKLASSAIGATFAAAGYGFVPSAEARAIASGATGQRRNFLIVPVPGLHAKIAEFATKFLADETLRAAFRRDPIDTLIAAGITPKKDKVTISKGNALFFYLLSNQALKAALDDAVSPYGGVRAALNPFTSSNTNFTSETVIREVNYAYTTAPDFGKSLEVQLAVLVDDPGARHILGVSDDLEIRREFVTTVSHGLIEQAQAYDQRVRARGGPAAPDTGPPVRPAIFVFNLNYFANANYQYNANVQSNANLNLNFNFNFNSETNFSSSTNFNAGGAGESDVSGFRFLSDSAHQRSALKRFCDQLASGTTAGGTVV